MIDRPRTNKQTNTVNTSRNNNINAIRFFAATMVVFGHSYMFLSGSTENEPGFMGVHVATFAVDIFFVLSGFLISQSWKRDSNYMRFFVRRSLRIFPGLIVVVLFSAFLLGPIMTSLSFSSYFSESETWAYLVNAIMPDVTHFRTLPGVFSDNPVSGAINTSLWTLKYELLCYVAVPFFYILTKRVNKKELFAAIPCMFLLFGIFFSATSDFGWSTALTNFTHLFYYFFVGVFIQEYKLERKINCQWAVVALSIMLVFSPDYGLLSFIVSSITIPVAVVGFSFVEKPVFGKCFTDKDYSYGLYIYAFPIQQIIVSIVPISLLSPLTLFLLSMLIATFFAALSWHIVENRAMSYGKRVTAALRGREQSDA